MQTCKCIIFFLLLGGLTQAINSTIKFFMKQSEAQFKYTIYVCVYIYIHIYMEFLRKEKHKYFLLTEHLTNTKKKKKHNNLKDSSHQGILGSKLIVQLVESLPDMYCLCKMLPIESYLNSPNTKCSPDCLCNLRMFSKATVFS